MSLSNHQPMNKPAVQAQVSETIERVNEAKAIDAEDI